MYIFDLIAAFVTLWNPVSRCAEEGSSRPCNVPCKPGMSGPKEVIWRMSTTSFFWQLANDGMVHATTARCMQPRSSTRETGQEEMAIPWPKAAIPEEERRQSVIKRCGDIPVRWAWVGTRMGKNEWNDGGPSVSVGFLFLMLFWPQSMLLPIHFVPILLLLLH